MKRWVASFAIAVLACAWIALQSPTSSSLLQDSDTAVLLNALEERSSPLSWFLGDWPLQNHFYRPVSTLLFEWDLALWGRDGAGFGATNTALCILSVLALFWFIRELTDSPFLAAGASLLLANLHFARPIPFGSGLTLAAIVAAFAVVLRPENLKMSAYASLLWVFAAATASGLSPFYGGVQAWLPGRTASSMTVFLLGAFPRTLGSNASERRVSLGRVGSSCLSALWRSRSDATNKRSSRRASSRSSPRTSGSTARGRLGRSSQARSRWSALMRFSEPNWFPSRPLAYQSQQFRSGPGVGMSLLGYAFPAGQALWLGSSSLALGWAVGFTSLPYSLALNVASNLAGLRAAVARPSVLAFGWVASLVAFLPMAWLKPFAHYDYLPTALRMLLAAGLIAAAAQATATAISRRAIPAPLRPDPAPGSLPRR
ncbi:MAG: hypothetical protein UZ18_ATM001001808 [Armatimonadetes bacterium OLB18]|nr:MAG: hypothetical protein UZ18_ATM001001808 [Armatimonadetes bacterium OLB18]